MGLYQPKALKKLLEDLKTHPRKSLSQNFLIDGNIVRKIIESSTVGQGDHVLEVGPGPGVLTEALLEKGAHVIAIEKDDRFRSDETAGSGDDDAHAGVVPLPWE